MPHGDLTQELRLINEAIQENIERKMLGWQILLSRSKVLNV